MKLYIEHDYYTYEKGEMIYKGTVTDYEYYFKDLDSAIKYARKLNLKTKNSNDYILVYKFEVCDKEDVIYEEYYTKR